MSNGNSNGNNEHDRYRSARIALRVIGGALVVVGAILAAIGFTSFFSAFNSDGESAPDKFWMCFVGLPLLAAGGWCLTAGFLGSISRYAANEAAPLWVRFAAILAPRQDRPPGRSPVAGGRFCASCGAMSAPGSRFCASCGQPAG